MTIRSINSSCMNIKIISLLVISFIFISCPGQTKIFIPVPDSSYFEKRNSIGIGINNITETKDSSSAAVMPEWLRLFINEGIEAVESLDRFYNKYVFIGINKGTDPAALNKWAEMFSHIYDFPVLAAERIEKRMIASASLYPNDEYGPFFERLVKRSYGASYPGTLKEETYWVKATVDNDNTADLASSETYIYFILITVDRPVMQSIIRNMIAQTENSSAFTSAQAASVNRLQQNFFEGF